MPSIKHQKLFFLHYPDASTLQAAYMPFVRNGGLFVPQASAQQLGDSVFLLIRLPGDPTALAVCGTVIWVSPENAEGVPGIGVRFNDSEGRVRASIENHLPDDKNRLQSFTL